MICRPWTTTTCGAASPSCTRPSTRAPPILSGDALLTLAFELLASPATHPDPGVRTELIASWRAAGTAGTAGGQWLDLEADKLGVPDAPNVAHVERLQG